jgi:hypothetical protein
MSKELVLEDMIGKDAELEVQEKELRQRRADLRFRLKTLSGTDADALALLDREPELADWNPAEDERQLFKVTKELAAVIRAREILKGDIEAKRAEITKAKIEEQHRAHRAGARLVVERAVALAVTVPAEREPREEIRRLEGAYVGSAQGIALPDGWLDLRDKNAGICHLIRESIRLGYIDGSEKFLAGIDWQP